MKAINKNAPAVCGKEIIIAANSEKVWKVLTAMEEWPRWHSAISRVKLNGPLQAGSSFEWKTDGFRIHSTLHTLVPRKALGWTGRALGTIAIHNWTLVETNGQTKVFAEESMDGFLVGLFKKSFNKTLASGMQTWLEALKRECEK